MGFIGIKKKGDEGSIEGLFVLPEYQGKGIGTALIKKVLTFLKKSNRILIEVLCYNKKAMRFYKSFGFEKEDGKAPDPLILPSGKAVQKFVMFKSC